MKKILVSAYCLISLFLVGCKDEPTSGIDRDNPWPVFLDIIDNSNPDQIEVSITHDDAWNADNMDIIVKGDGGEMIVGCSDTRGRFDPKNISLDVSSWGMTNLSRHLTKLIRMNGWTLNSKMPNCI